MNESRLNAGNAIPEVLSSARLDELSGLASHLQDTHEELNRRLARELHDDLGSLLTAAKLDITFIKSRCAKAAPELVAKCDRIAGMIDQAAALKRRIIDELRPSTLDMLGLGPALRELLDNFSQATGVPTRIEMEDDNPATAGLALVVYRVVEAALGRARPHAPTMVGVTVARAPGSLSLRIAAEGTGEVRDRVEQGVDIAGIRQRILAAGGTVEFSPAAGEGCIVTATIPLRDSSAG